MFYYDFRCLRWMNHNGELPINRTIECRMDDALTAPCNTPLTRIWDASLLH